MTNEIKGLYIVFSITCLLAGYGAMNSYLTKNVLEKELVRLYTNDKEVMELIVQNQKARDYTPILEKIITHMEKKDAEVEALQKDFDFMLKDYAELRFPNKKPQGLYTEFGLFDVIEEDNKSAGSLLDKE